MSVSADQVDRAGVKVGTIQNSPSDRSPSRTLKAATLERIPLTSNFPADAVEMLRSGKADVFEQTRPIDAIAILPWSACPPGRVQHGARGDSAAERLIGRGAG